MLRYIVAAALAGLLVMLAIRSSAPANSAPRSQAETVVGPQPEVALVNVPGGRDLRVRHRFAGSVSRARLVYELDGNDRTLDKTSNCQKSLATSATVKGDSYSGEVELGGRLPYGATQIRLVLEDETGTTVLPVNVD